MSDPRPIINYQPTYVVTGSANGVVLIEATLDDFMLPEEFVSVVCGVFHRRGYGVETIGDMVEQLRRLTAEDSESLRQVGAQSVLVVIAQQAQQTEGKPYARVWTWKEPVSGIIRAAADAAKLYGTVSPVPTPLTTPILGKQIPED